MFTKILPHNSKRRRVVKTILGKRSLDPYSLWRIEQSDKIKLYEYEKLDNKPMISVVVPAFNTPEKYLEPFVSSVVSQTYSNWELVIVDASTQVDANKRIVNIANIDTRIRVIRTENKGISSNTNIGIKAAKGEYIGFMDHDDTLDYGALFEVARVINKTPDVGFIYSDEDKLSEDGKKYLDPHFKPDWSPHLLAHVNYITHFSVARKDIIKSVGYLDSNKDGAQDFDLILKITDTDTRIVHIPKILYHWRVADNSTAADISNKPYVLKAGERALVDHYKRKKINTNVKARSNMPGFYDVSYLPAKNATVIVLPFANETLVSKYVGILLKLNLINPKDIIIPSTVKGVESERIVNFSDLKDYLNKSLDISSKNAVFLGDFVIPINKNWAKELSGLLDDQQVNAVAPVIINTDNEILDMGLIKTGREERILFEGFKLGDSTPFGNTSWPRNVDKLSGSVLAARTSDLKLYLRRDSSKTDTLLQDFTSLPDNSKFNVLWSRVAMKHVKTPIANGNKRSLFNEAIFCYKDEIHLYADEQQVMDSLISIEERGQI